MTQNRDAPAFQEYAANMMAKIEYRLLSLEARGLLYTMRLECWVNGGLPSSPAQLARVLGFDVEQVKAALAAIAPFFAIENDTFVCPELIDYRAHLAEQRRRQSEGGKASAAKLNKDRKRSSPSKRAGSPQVASESLVKQSPVQSNTTQALEGGRLDNDWLNDYERASRGH